MAFVNKGNAFAIGKDLGAGIEFPFKRQSFHITTGQFQLIKLGGAAAVGGEDQTLTIGHPRRLVVEGVMVHHTFQFAGRQIHHIDIWIAILRQHHGQFLAIR